MQATSADLAAGSPSAAVFVFGLRALLARTQAGFRLHVEAPWLETLLDLARRRLGRIRSGADRRSVAAIVRAARSASRRRVPAANEQERSMGLALACPRPARVAAKKFDNPLR